MSAMSYAQVLAAGRAEERTMVETERRGDRALITLSDPGKLNALSAPLMVQLLAAAHELAADSGIRSIVLTGAGDAFCAGILYSAAQGMDLPEALKLATAAAAASLTDASASGGLRPVAELYKMIDKYGFEDWSTPC